MPGDSKGHNVLYVQVIFELKTENADRARNFGKEYENLFLEGMNHLGFIPTSR